MENQGQWSGTRSSHIWPRRYLLDFAKPVSFLLLNSDSCCWLWSDIRIQPSAQLGQGAGAHKTTASASALSGPPGAWGLVTSPHVEGSGWEYATASARPILPLPLLSRAEGRGAGMQLHPTQMGSWAQLELEAKRLELEAKKSLGSHHWGIRGSSPQGTKMPEQALATTQKRFHSCS